MTWIRIDDQFADHPKLLAVGPLGLALQISAICYCARHLTDGFMSRVTVRALVAKLSLPWSDQSGVDWSAAATSGMQGCEASEFDWPGLMVEAGLWDEVDGGYKVHDYEHFNPTKAQVTKQREAWSERQSRSRSRRDTSVTHAPVTRGVTPSVTRGVTGLSPSPVPDPDPHKEEEEIGDKSPPDPGGSDSVREVWESYIDGWRRHIGKGAEPKLTTARRSRIKARIREHKLPTVLAAAAGVWRSQWHLENGRTDPDLVFRDAGHIEQFAAKSGLALPTNPQLPLGSSEDDEAKAEADRRAKAAGERAVLDAERGLRGEPNERGGMW